MSDFGVGDDGDSTLWSKDRPSLKSDPVGNGVRLAGASARLERLTPSGVQESDEIYLLAPAGGSVKIRDALMDIKVLREVNADGLEQWTPVMKAGFCSSKPVRPQTTSCMRCCRRSSPGS